MTLVNRVSGFFLAALAVALAIYSGAFWWIVRSQLQRQFNQQLYSAFSSLAAAVEVEPQDVTWQPSEHTIGLGTDESVSRLRWAVFGDRTQVVDASANASPAFLAEAKRLAEDADSAANVQEVQRADWRYLRQRLAAPAPNRQLRDLDEFDEVAIVVGRSTVELQATLRRLAILASTLPVGGWLIAAAIGRWLCRRALWPVVDMAHTAKRISAASFERRFPESSSDDELATLSRSFNGLLDRLQASYESQRRFTGDAAHELRTPLTVLLGQIDVALRRPRTAADYQQTLSLLRDEATKLQAILNSLLFLARAEQGAAAADQADVDLGPWLARHLQRPQYDQRRADLRLAVEQPVAALASKQLLAQVVDNLLSNALKYSPPGTPIEVRAGRLGDEAVVAVKDQGIGLSAEDQRRVFQPFFRSSAARSLGAAGAGLGLAVAARLAAAMHGRLQCHSELGSGSAFSIHLPLASAPAPAPSPRTANEQSPARELRH
ncbi:MAG: HAMP domain-containing protein [Pirellulales bacterium]|nr:HAMP domain-containing protein [Pirellulales bacterium]